MPIYDYRCPACEEVEEVFQHNMADIKRCGKCQTPMDRVPSFPAMVKIKGEGGYPSRRKQIRNTTYRKHPKLEHEPNRIYL